MARPVYAVYGAPRGDTSAGGCSRARYAARTVQSVLHQKGVQPQHHGGAQAGECRSLVERARDVRQVAPPDGRLQYVGRSLYVCSHLFGHPLHLLLRNGGGRHKSGQVAHVPCHKTGSGEPAGMLVQRVPQPVFRGDVGHLQILRLQLHRDHCLDLPAVAGMVHPEARGCVPVRVAARGRCLYDDRRDGVVRDQYVRMPAGRLAQRLGLLYQDVVFPLWHHAFEDVPQGGVEDLLGQDAGLPGVLYGGGCLSSV